MATGRRHRRSNKKDKTPKSKRVSKNDVPTAAGAPPTSANDVPDHLLELILLHLESSACLLRAAAACKRWRRIVAAAGFLPRYRSLHAQQPFVAGHYHAFDPDWVDYESPPITANPAFVPSPSLAVDGRHFSLDDGFLPDSDSGWALADSRGGLLLLFRRRTGWDAHLRSRSFPDLLVCEPLARRCQGILRPPEQATCLGVFLLDVDGGDHAVGMSSMSNFRVVSVLHEDHASEEGRGTPVACVFTSGSDGGWRVVLPAAAAAGAVSLPGAIDCISFAGRVNGSLYWVTGEDGAGASMLVLDEATMEFSRVPFLTDGDDISSGPYDRWSFRVIGGKDVDDHASLRVVRLVSNELMVLVRRRRRHGGDERWVVEKLVRLPEATLGLEGRRQRFFQRDAMIVAAHETYVVVTPREKKTWLFSVELETLRVEREHPRNKYAGTAYPFELPLPPRLVVACAQHGRRRQSCH